MLLSDIPYDYVEADSFSVHRNYYRSRFAEILFTILARRAGIDYTGNSAL